MPWLYKLLSHICVALHHTTLQHTTLHCTTLHCTTLSPADKRGCPIWAPPFGLRTREIIGVGSAGSRRLQERGRPNELEESARMEGDRAHRWRLIELQGSAQREEEHANGGRACERGTNMQTGDEHANGASACEQGMNV